MHRRMLPIFAMSQIYPIITRVSYLRHSRISRWNPVAWVLVLSRDSKMAAGGRTREYRMRVDESEVGRVPTEFDTGSSLAITTTVFPRDGASLVRICTIWDGAGGGASLSGCSRQGRCGPSMRASLSG
jgi:hypothetical protein